MFTIFLFCAVIAGTVFIFQFVTTLVGFGLEGADADLDAPHDFSVDVGQGDLHAGDAPTDAAHGHHGSTWLFGVISVRTVVAALTVFGLAGMAGLSSFGDGTMGHVYATIVALLAGTGAMFGVHFLMRSLHQLGADGKLQLSNAVGQSGTVYLTIPANNAGSGKIHLRVQGRLAELAARTSYEENLPAGTSVRVIGVAEGSTLRVEPVRHMVEK